MTNLKLPDLQTAQLQVSYPSIGQALFGSDAFIDDSDFLKEPVRRFIDTLVISNWGRLRGRVTREGTKVKTLQKAVEKDFEGILTSQLVY